MTEQILLGDKAHCRFGDKGDTGMYVLIPYNIEEFGTLVANVTSERVGRYLGNIPPDQVTCIPCPDLGALVIVVRASLAGGVTRSLSLDAHGKTRSGYLLGMPVPWE